MRTDPSETDRGRTNAHFGQGLRLFPSLSTHTQGIKERLGVSCSQEAFTADETYARPETITLELPSARYTKRNKIFGGLTTT